MTLRGYARRSDPDSTILPKVSNTHGLCQDNTKTPFPPLLIAFSLFLFQVFKIVFMSTHAHVVPHVNAGAHACVYTCLCVVRDQSCVLGVVPQKTHFPSLPFKDKVSYWPEAYRLD